MIERQILSKKVKEFQVTEYIANVLDKPGYSHTEIQRTPVGEKVVIYTSKPGLIVGRKGSNIKELTEVLKSKFGMENPQIEVSEIENPNLNPHSIAKHIVHTFERFGPGRFKFLGYKMLQEIINAGAIGAEIVISGRGVPSKRS
ncbi:MAG: 30S ribosomal protein S3, partial [Nanoarchaeota archaeon]|nr:30S ribosomal protein S3 [Nanoarchaeota archaeon]